MDPYEVQNEDSDVDTVILQCAEEEKIILRQRIHFLEQRLHEANLEIMEIQEISDQRDNLQQEIFELKNRIAFLERTIIAMDHTRNIMQDVISAQRNESQQEIFELKQENSELIKEKSELRKEFKEEISELKKENSNLRKENSELDKRNEKLEDENTYHNTYELKNENSELKNETYYLDKRNRKLENDISKFKKDTHTLKRENRYLRKFQQEYFLLKQSFHLLEEYFKPSLNRFRWIEFCFLARWSTECLCTWVESDEIGGKTYVTWVSPEMEDKFMRQVYNFYKTIMNSNKTIMNSNKTIMNSNKTIMNFNKTIMNFNKTIMNSNKTIMNSNKTLCASQFIPMFYDCLISFYELLRLSWVFNPTELQRFLDQLNALTPTSSTSPNPDFKVARDEAYPFLSRSGCEWVVSDELGENTYAPWVSPEMEDKFRREGKAAIIPEIREEVF